MRSLAGNRSPRWAFMEKFEIPDLDLPLRNYLTRWRLIQTPWFAIMLHRMDAPDSRETLHDHPWPFVSIVLRGGYVERRLDPASLEVDETHVVRRVNRSPLGMAHSIRYLLRKPTWTLVFAGRRSRVWGYLDPVDPDSGYRWTRFDVHEHSVEFDRAMEARRRTREVAKRRIRALP